MQNTFLQILIQKPSFQQGGGVGLRRDVKVLLVSRSVPCCSTEFLPTVSQLPSQPPFTGSPHFSMSFSCFYQQKDQQFTTSRSFVWSVSVVSLYILRAVRIGHISNILKWSTQHQRDISVQFSSVAQSCLTLCNPMNCSMLGLPVHHQLPESTQTHVHCVGDVIQPSHSLLSPSPPALNLSQHQGLFKWVSSLHQVAKVWEFQLQHQSFQWTPRTDLL